jgi:hypothetical protein
MIETEISLHFNPKGSAETLLIDVNITSNILNGGTIGLGGADDLISYDNVTITQN